MFELIVGVGVMAPGGASNVFIGVLATEREKLILKIAHKFNQTFTRL